MLSEAQRCLWTCHHQQAAGGQRLLPLDAAGRTAARQRWAAPLCPQVLAPKRLHFFDAMAVGPQTDGAAASRPAAQTAVAIPRHTTPEGSLSRVSPALVLLSVGACFQGSLPLQS